MIKLYVLSPGTIMFITAIAIMVTRGRLRKAVSVLGSAAAMVATCCMYAGSDGGLTAGSSVTATATAIKGGEQYISLLFSGFSTGLPEADRLSLIFLFAFSIVVVIGAIYNLRSDNSTEMASAAAYAGCAMSVVLATDWISFVIYWEIMAIVSWLVVISSGTTKARQAGGRYLAFHMLGGNLLLAGVILQVMSEGIALENLSGGGIAYWLILAGVAVNAAVPPFNGWLADAYPESTVSGSFYLSSFTTKVAIYAMIRIYAGTELLIYVGVFMALFGAAMALLENDLRRLLAFHIISQLGYMIAALGIGSPMGIDGAGMHALNNILYKGTMFMCAGAVILATGKKRITDLGGLYKKMPLVSACFLVSSLAIAGFPLFNGFVSKGLIMGAIAEEGRGAVELLMMVASVGTLMSVVLKVNFFVFFGREPKGAKAMTVDDRKVTRSMKIAMVLGAGACVITGVAPKLLEILTPYQTAGHPYTVDHVTQYVQLFAAATIPFIIFLKKMKPHEGITLDTDWIFRKPLKRCFVKAQNLIARSMSVCGMVAKKLVKRGYKILRSPRTLVDYMTGLEEKDKDGEEKFKGLEHDNVLKIPSRLLVAMNMSILALLILGAFLLKR